jgi:lambda repressor-like predicted transcriptional regulator
VYLHIVTQSLILLGVMEIDVKNEIKAIIYESGFTLNQVAEKIGMAPNNLSNMLARRSIRYSVAKQIAEAIGYELKFRKKD